MNKNDLKPEVCFAHNLCKLDNYKNRYRPFGLPRQVGPEGLNLLSPLSDGRVVVSGVDGTAVFDPKTGELLPITTVGSRCACRAAANTVATCTRDGAMVMERLPTGRLAVVADTRSEWPGVSIIAEPMSPLTMSVEGVSLGRLYSAGDTVSEGDRARLSRVVKSAYEDLYTRTSEQGVFFQPVLARAVVRDAEGNMVWRGPEVLVSVPKGVFTDSRVVLPMVLGNETRAWSAEVPTFRLRVRTSAMVEKMCVERAAELYVEVVSCFHAWTCDPSSSTGDVTVRRIGTADQAVSIAVPGAERSLSLTETGRNVRLIDAALLYFDRLCTSVKVADRPYERGVDVLVGAYGMRSLKDSYAMMSRALEDKDRLGVAGDLRHHRLNAPHRFTAAHAGSTPSGVAYGNLGAILYEGYSPTDYAASTDDSSSPWFAVTTVTYTDGSVSRRVSRGDTNRPTSLSPLITYPDASAVSIDIMITDTAGKEAPVQWTVALTADITGYRGVGLAQNLAERQPDGYDGPVDDTVRTVSRPVIAMANVVAVADPENPLYIKKCIDNGSEVRALVAGMSNGGAWDFGRTRFYAFSPDSVTLVNVSSGLTSIATTILASVGIRGSASVAVTDSGETFFLGTTGTLYRIKGSDVAAMAKLPEWVDCLGFDVSDLHLLASATSGRGVVYHVAPSAGSVSMTSTSPGPLDCMMRVEDMLLAPTQSGGLVDMSLRNRMSPYDGVEVKLALDCVSSGSDKPCRLSGVIWPVDSSAFDGRISIAHKYITRRHAETTGIALKGRLISPVAIRVAARPFNGVYMEISGRASADTVIVTPTIVTRKINRQTIPFNLYALCAKK